jgi:hypothetical protein
MFSLLANAEQVDQSLGNIQLILLMCFWLVTIAAATFVPIVIAWRRNHRHGGMIVVGALFIGILSAASALKTISDRDKWFREDDLLLRTGYYDPREHGHDPPAAPLALWALLGGGFGVMVLWSLIPLTKTQAYEPRNDTDEKPQDLPPVPPEGGAVPGPETPSRGND